MTATPNTPEAELEAAKLAAAQVEEGPCLEAIKVSDSVVEYARQSCRSLKEIERVVAIMIHSAMIAYSARQNAALKARCEELQSVLLRTTGSLGLIIKGARPDGTGHKDNYERAIAVIDKFPDEADRICAAAIDAARATRQLEGKP